MLPTVYCLPSTVDRLPTYTPTDLPARPRQYHCHYPLPLSVVIVIAIAVAIIMLIVFANITVSHH
jgi:hypothetical protein